MSPNGTRHIALRAKSGVPAAFSLKTRVPQQPVNVHGSQVASVISASINGTLCGAAKAQFYYANDGDSMYFPHSGDMVDTVGCNANATARAYDWFASIGDYSDPFKEPPISAVNESYGCVREQVNCQYSWARSAEGITQDYYAHVYGMPIVKAAGNMNCVFDGLGERHEACPFTLNSLCVGANASDGTMSTFSSYRNPGTTSLLGPPVPFDRDREEPDLVALGGQKFSSDEFVCVSDPINGGWMGERGTSLAAPLVTSTIALFREYCEPLFGRLGQREIRAIFRTMAYAGDAMDTAYSTPRPNQDFRDGAGILHASTLYGICSGDWTNGGFGPVTVDLDGGPLPQDKRLFIPGWAPFGETQAFDSFPALGPQDFQHSPAVDTFLVGKTLWEGTLPSGSRLRFTFSWDACPLNDTGDAPAAVAVDFDVFLRRVGYGYVWASQSLDDNNEGFDYTVPVDQGGEYEVWLAWPEGSLSCEGTDEEVGGMAWYTP